MKRTPTELSNARLCKPLFLLWLPHTSPFDCALPLNLLLGLIAVIHSSAFFFLFLFLFFLVCFSFKIHVFLFFCVFFIPVCIRGISLLRVSLTLPLPPPSSDFYTYLIQSVECIYCKYDTTAFHLHLTSAFSLAEVLYIDSVFTMAECTGDIVWRCFERENVMIHASAWTSPDSSIPSTFNVITQNAF